MPDEPGDIHNDMSGRVDGAFVQAGVVHGDVNLYTGARVHSHYRHQIERIAPPALLGRDAELRELADFARSSDTTACYRWWRAGPWAGKTALMSSFVLNPPPGVRIVSFFVTARLPGQSDRAAFVDAVLEQLLTVLGKPAPALYTAAVREAHLAGLLIEAAEKCRARGETLLLVVDGLDEDRGHTGDHDAHSVAGVLPARLPPGMKVVVAGRPDPPVPQDVPPDHPLRDPSIVRPLDGSPHATALRGEMERDIKRLVTGTGLEQDLLGFLAASGGGLTATDLVQLTGADRWQVQDVLDTVSGRGFSRRPGSLDPAAAEVYLFGHEQLNVIARDLLATRLPGYLDRIHAWADDHRRRGWPSGTSEYLLRGYHAMLLAAGDLDRATRLCTDPARHDRLRAVTGADHNAIVQITGTFDATDDLTAACRLTVHLEHLERRNTTVPLLLPALWARSGHPTRALALARSITWSEGRDQALELVASALVVTGDHEAATQAAEEITDTGLRERTVAAVVNGDSDYYAETARSWHSVPRPPSWQGIHLAALAADDHARAVELAESIKDGTRDQLLAAVVEQIGEAGDHRVALDITNRISSAFSRGLALRAVLGALAWSGEHEQALAVAESITEFQLRSDTLVAVAAALLERGRHVLATEVIVLAVATAQARAQPERRWSMLLGIAGTMVDTGDHEQAVEVIRRAEAVARELAGPEDYCQALVEVAVAFAGVGDDQKAIEIARSLAGTRFHDGALASIALTMARAGRLTAVKRILRMTREPVRHNEILTNVAVALVKTGRVGRAMKQVGRLSTGDSPAKNTSDLLVIAGALAEEGYHGLVAEVVDHATRGRDRLGGFDTRVPEAIPPVVAALTAAGDHTRAARIACVVARLTWGGDPAAVVRALTGTCDLDAAIGGVGLLVSEALRERAWLAVARALAGTVESEQVLDKVSAAPDHLRGLGFLAMARAYHEIGDDRNAVRFAIRALRTHPWEGLVRQMCFVSRDAALAMLDEVESLAQ